MKKQTLIPDSRSVVKQSEQNNIPKSSNFIEKGMKRPENNFKSEINKPAFPEYNNNSNKIQNNRLDVKPQATKTITPNKKAIDQAELEEARESLRLLKMKNRNNQLNSKPKIDNGDSGTGNLMDNINSINNNYRKAFKPAVSQDKTTGMNNRNTNENINPKGNLNSMLNTHGQSQNNKLKNDVLSNNKTKGNNLEGSHNPFDNINSTNSTYQKNTNNYNKSEDDYTRNTNNNSKSNRPSTSNYGNSNKTMANNRNINEYNEEENFYNKTNYNNKMTSNVVNNQTTNKGKNNEYNEDNYVKNNSKNNNARLNNQQYNINEDEYTNTSQKKNTIPTNKYGNINYNDDYGNNKNIRNQNSNNQQNKGNYNHNNDEDNYNYGSSKNTKTQNNNNNMMNNNKNNFNQKVQNKFEKLQNFDVEELEDNRPAIAQNKDKEFEELLEEEEIEEEDDNDVERVECTGCGRRFKPESLQKHKKICKKVFQTKRKTFDMKKQRIIDGEHLEIVKNAEYTEKKGKNKPQSQVQDAKKKANKEKWKKQSEEFRRMLRGSNQDKVEEKDGYVVGGGTGGGMINKPEPSYDDGLEHCSICNRRYNSDAYKKHLPTCERKRKEMMIKNGGKNTQANGKMKK